MRWVALGLGLLLVISGVAVLRLLPRVSASQRPLLRGVAVAQLGIGGLAALLAALGGVI